MAAHSQHSDVPLKKCPTSRGIEFSTYWHRFIGIEDFFICFKCFQEHFQNSFLETFYESFNHDPLPGHSATCDFNNTIQARRLVQAARSSHNAEEILSFARKRASTGGCAGLAGVRGGNSVIWYTNDEIPHFVMCESCFLDYCPSPPLSSGRFYQKNPVEHKSGDLWFCDLAVPQIRRLALEFAHDDQWPAFRNATNYRMSLPACQAQAVKRNSRRWFCPTVPWSIRDMMVCEACMLDHAGEKSALQYFAEVRIPSSEGDHTWICDFQTLSIATCTDELFSKDHDRWHRTVADIVSKPVCAHGNIENGEWYSLVDPTTGSELPNSDICAACFAGHFAAIDYTHILTRKTFPPGTTRLCDFSPLYGRSRTFLAKWKQLLFTGDHRPLISYASRVSELPLCPRDQTVTKRHWWGHDLFFFCTSCYHEFGQDTIFAASFPIQNRVYESACCDMYTANMRRRYTLACRSGSLDDFNAYCQRRADVKAAYDQAVRNRVESQQINQVYRKYAIAGMGQAHLYGNLGSMASNQTYQPLLDPIYMGATQTAILAPRGANPAVAAAEMEMLTRWKEVE